ncbi:dihydroorotate dehydrogenase electron transfer subunit [Frisingicoccus sp.]|uniref:dihydroorotate dehydrogenase electron transfer subunit n=1 Tax=Frisingicoccus sp. TaxID=1918627 RepID=UPI003735477F
MEKVCKMFQIISQKKITEDIFSLWIEVGDMVKDIRPGQFVSVYCGDDSRLLPRPISICEVAKATKAIRLVYRVVGEGTKELSMMKAEEEVKMILPLGNGYTLKEDKAILIAGGIGIPPMLQLAKELKKVEKTVVLGFKDSQTFLLNEFSFIPKTKVIIATEDGSVGIKGNVLDAIREEGVEGDVIYSCGPTPMLRAVKAYAQEKGIEAQISLEERMACGIGACLACVCQSKEVDHHSNVHNKRVCKDGPVFNAQEVEL